MLYDTRLMISRFILFLVFRKDGGTLRQMNAEKLLKTLPQLQNQLDALVDFEVISISIRFN